MIQMSITRRAHPGWTYLPKRRARPAFGRASGRSRPLVLLAVVCLCGCGKSAEQEFNRGVGHVTKRDWDPAAAAFEAALKADPNLAEAHFALGKVHFHQEKYEEAATQYREGLRLKPNNPEGLLSLGLANFERGFHKEALRAFHKAMLIDENFGPAIYGMARAYRALAERTDDPEQRSKYTAFALMYLLRTIEKQPDYFLAHQLLGELYEDLAEKGTGDQRMTAMEQALRYYDQASALHGGNQQILLAMIRLHSVLGDFKRVKELADHILILSRVNDTRVPPIVMAYKARSEEELGNYAQAIEDLGLFLREAEKLPTDGLTVEEREARERQVEEARAAVSRCRKKLAEKPPTGPAEEQKNGKADGT